MTNSKMNAKTNKKAVNNKNKVKAPVKKKSPVKNRQSFAFSQKPAKSFSGRSPFPKEQKQKTSPYSESLNQLMKSVSGILDEIKPLIKIAYEKMGEKSSPMPEEKNQKPSKEDSLPLKKLEENT